MTLRLVDLRKLHFLPASDLSSVVTMTFPTCCLTPHSAAKEAFHRSSFWRDFKGCPFYETALGVSNMLKPLGRGLRMARLVLEEPASHLSTGSVISFRRGEWSEAVSLVNQLFIG